MDWPFLGTEALAAGAVNRYQLATRYDAVHRNVYVPRGQVLTPADKAHAAWLFSRRRATLVGLSAAAIHGAKWIDERLPAELNQRSQHKIRGVVLRNDTLTADEVCTVRGFPVTTAARTAFDLGRRYGRTLAVIRVDALLQATSLKLTDVEALIDVHRGARGVVQLREVVQLADTGAESPQETRTRLVLTDAGSARHTLRSTSLIATTTTWAASTWAIRSGRSASNTTDPSPGKTRRSEPPTSSARPDSRR